MVIGPSEARQTLLQKMAPKIMEMEKTIDNALINAGGENVSVTLRAGYSGPYDDPRTNVPYNVIEELLDQYRNAGWEVKIESDQRDGDFIVFRPERRSGRIEGFRTTRQRSDDFGPYGSGGPRPYE